MSVNVQHAPQCGQFKGRLIRPIREPLVTIPDDRALAGTRIDDDKSDLIVGAFYRFREIEIYAFVFNRQQTKSPIFVGTETAGIRSLEAEPLQGNHGARGLSAG